VSLVECLVFGFAMLPGALLWEMFALRTYPYVLVRFVVLGMASVPAYGLFAFSLMVLLALSTRWLGWRTPADAEMPIKALEWPLLCWVRYIVSVHVVRLFAGSVFCVTPLWTFYLRLNGARLGRGVYINSLAVNDHNLLGRRPRHLRRPSILLARPSQHALDERQQEEQRQENEDLDRHRSVLPAPHRASRPGCPASPPSPSAIDSRIDESAWMFFMR
jgi:hypothetical protein